MKMKGIWFSWLYLFILCAVLGFIPPAPGFFKVLFAFLGSITGNFYTACLILFFPTLYPKSV